MIFDDYVELLNYVEIAGDFEENNDKIISIIQNKFENDKILYKSVVKKINDYGWSNVRSIYLTNSTIINTDDKCKLKSNKELFRLQRCIICFYRLF